MLALTRHKLLEHLQTLSNIVDFYRRHDPLFESAAIDWLEKVEQTFLQLRHPLAGSVAVERAKILAVSDGYRDYEASLSGTSRRKAGNVTLVIVLGRVETMLLQDVMRIDTQFSSWREKMAQFIAVATNEQPIPLPPSEPRQVWLQQLWHGFHTTPETHSMYVYLNTVMSSSDRLYLLDELIENLLHEI